MTALDTNVLVRIVMQDDPDQAAVARAIMKSGPLWVSKTVLLELEWVLRYSYGLNRRVIEKILARLLGMRHLHVEDREAVLLAHLWFVGGMDFADALHLASSYPAARFATFDRKLAQKARTSNAMSRIQLLDAASWIS